MKEAMERPAPVLLEPIMLVTLSRARGLRRRRHRRPQLAPRAAAGHGAGAAGMTEVKAEVPMAEMLTYAPDLRSLTGGQGDYTMEFARYEEVPAPRGQGRRIAADEEAAAHA